MVDMLITGGVKYNKKKRKKHQKNKKKSNKGKKRCKKKRSQRGKKILQNQKKADKWKPERYQHDTLKVPLIVFGTGMFNKCHVKLKGNRVGVTGIVYRTLKKREANGDLVVVDIDEYKTSKVCNKCQVESLNIFDGVRGCGVLACKTCFTLWNRDVNASKNMMSISLSVWKGYGRPPVFSRN